MTKRYDFLVIGSGIAGMSFALKVAATAKAALVCKTTLDEANTFFAQGGVASVTNLEVDNFDKHIEDTMIAGDWLSDRKAVEKVVRNVIEERMQLEQFSDCEITLKELSVIRQTLVETLSGVYHRRVKYPSIRYAKDVDGSAKGEV